MAKTYAQIRAEIDRLERQADSLRRKEVADVVARIKAAIAHYDLTAADLGFEASGSRGRVAGAKAHRAAGATAGGVRGRARHGRRAGNKTTASRGAAGVGPAGKAKRRVIPVKYRDGAGNTWTGRGSRPRWLQAELARGKSIEQFLVN